MIDLVKIITERRLPREQKLAHAVLKFYGSVCAPLSAEPPMMFSNRTVDQAMPQFFHRNPSGRK